jgi:MoxR-like ATPase
VTGSAEAVDTDAATAFALARQFDLVVGNVCSTYLGNERVVRLALACLMAEGHLLVEDRPGVGKTTLAKALARSLGVDFRRVQFTADLLPSDVTGAVVFDRERGALEFRRGPVFTNVLLADELNRASPKAQSALLESMEERQVSVEGTSYPLPRPFLVLATQNPFDAAGTFPLPHSQRDRFLLRVSLGYPDRQAEEVLLDPARDRPEPEDLSAVCDPDTVAAFGAAVRRVHVAPEVRGYVMDLVAATRSHPDLAVGASSRAALALVRVACSLALGAGRAYVVPDDVKEIAEPALAHRLLLEPAAELAGIGADAVVRDIVASLPVPVGGRFS